MDLTPASIEHSKPGDILRDKTIPGFHLRVFAVRKSYYLYFRTKTKQERRPKIGDHGVVTLSQARSIARGMLAEVAAGRDPISDRNKESKAHTMAWLCNAYLKECSSIKKSCKNDTYIVDSYILPTFKTVRISDITFREVNALHKSKCSTPYQANRILSLLSSMFNQAIIWGERAPGDNPCTLVTRFPEQKRKRHMSSDEAVRINEALSHYQAQYPGAVLFVYLLILSGARKGEIAKATPAQIVGNKLHDLGDNKTGDDRPIYLPEPVLELIKGLPAEGTLTGIQDPRKVWAKVRSRAGCPDLRLHDLRRSYASAALSLGYSLDQIGKLLRHKSTSTTARYAWLGESVENQVAENTAQRIVDVMAGRTTFAG